MQAEDRIEYRLWTVIVMTRAERDTYRAEHTLAAGDSTRGALADTFTTEMEGLGLSSGWWSQAHFH